MGYPMTDKYKNAVGLYESGMSIRQVADVFGKSRQSMHSYLQRRGCKFRSQLRYGKDNNFYRGGITKDEHSNDVVEKAVLKGRLVPQPCEVCGDFSLMSDGRRNVQAHHDDYNYPLNIRWLCQKHHHEWHKNNKAIKKQQDKANNEN